MVVPFGRNRRRALLSSGRASGRRSGAGNRAVVPDSTLAATSVFPTPGPPLNGHRHHRVESVGYVQLFLSEVHQDSFMIIELLGGAGARA